MSHGFTVAAALWTLLAWGAVGPAPARAQAAQAAPPVVTRHAGVFGGRRVSYDAIVEETVVPTAKGAPGAIISSFSYLERVRKPDVSRPVLFVFNGGPGSASIWTHFGFFGPRRVEFPDPARPATVAPFAVVDNEYSLLDVADIVFIDPVRTGFSRLLPGVPPEEFLGTTQDARATADFIRQWLTRHGRWNSPKFVAGASYGTTRAIALAGALVGGVFPPQGRLEAITLNGIVVLGPALGGGGTRYDGNDRTHVSDLPTMAATAWYHGRLGSTHRPVEAAIDAARAFANDEYLKALNRGYLLDPAEKQRVATRLAELTGVPAAAWQEANLRLGTATFQSLLLKERGLEIGSYDGRFVLPAGGGKDPVIDDPSMGQYTPGFVGAFNHYLSSELGLQYTERYVSIAWTDVNFLWDYGAGPGVPVTRNDSTPLAAAMRRNPGLRVFVGAGYYDFVTTLGAAEYALAHAPLPRERLTLKGYPAGHLPYLGAANAAALAADLRNFVRSAVPSPAAPTPVVDRLVEPAVASRSVVLDGKRVDYRAAWFETVLKDEAGVPQATISATSYVREGLSAGDRARRPVMVFFNGGPGASSSPLHFTAFGPRRRTARDVDAGATMVDNPASPIDVADLLFIDPVGTGFSRELREGGGRAYWSVTGDPASVLRLLRGWLRENGRSESPLVITGQSYGGLRAALMAQDMTDLNVVAMVLISPATDYTGSAAARSNDNPYVFSLPAMAVAAWHHGKVGAGGRDIVRGFESARAFAQGEDLVALRQGALLPVAERTRMAARVAEFIGLPAATVEAADLRVDTQDFLELLLADAGKVVGRLDTRVAAVRATVPSNADRPPAANDPALGLGKSNVVKSGIAARYFREELGLRTDRDYYGVTLDVNFKWDWSGALPSQGVGARHWFDATPKLAQLLAAKPRARLLVVSGYFDLATPLLAVRHAMSHAGLPPERVEWLALPGSHSPYDDPDSLGVLAGRLRALAKL